MEVSASHRSGQAVYHRPYDGSDTGGAEPPVAGNGLDAG